MRTFLGLSFSVAMSRRIAEQLEKEAVRIKELRPKALAQDEPVPSAPGLSLAWVPPANLHVTLKFFGSIPTESVDAIALRLRQRLAEVPPVSLRAKGYGVFPSASEGPPRILWIGVSGGKPLEALHGLIEREMEDLGFAREPRPFAPHVTVARLLAPPPAALPIEQLWSSEMDFGEEKLAELIVYESVSQERLQQKSSRAGVEYLARARVPFSKERS